MKALMKVVVLTNIGSHKGNHKSVINVINIMADPGFPTGGATH